MNMIAHVNAVLRGPMRLPQTPLDLAAETAKALYPGGSWTFYREYVRDLHRTGAGDDARDRLILRRYRDALIAYRETEGCE